MKSRIVSALWGDLHGEELKKFLLLATGFFFLIGSYWPLKTLKDSVFINTVGSKYQPDAKIASLILFLPLVLLYSKLVDLFAKEKMLYMLIAIYGSLGMLFVYFLQHPTIGLANPDQGPHRWIGWTFFVFIESYISLLVSLYWAFIHDISTPESAKKGYGMLIFATQLGGVSFTLLGNYLSRDVKLYVQRAPLIAFISICMLFVIALVIFILTHVIKHEALAGYQTNQDKDHTESVGFFKGLKTLIAHPYVAGIFGIVFLHEIITAVMHFQLLHAVEATYAPNKGQINLFLFNFALTMQSVSCLFALFGTSFFQRKFGNRFCLVSYPIMLGIAISFYLVNPTLSMITAVVIVAKGINYSFNQPAKEALYIPTTRAIKYKAKAWIDMFGLRSAKGAGSLVNKTVGLMVNLTGIVSLIVIVFWSILAYFIGTKHRDVIAQKKRIGH